jgi:hypothetical protein
MTDMHRADRFLKPEVSPRITPDPSRTPDGVTEAGSATDPRKHSGISGQPAPPPVLPSAADLDAVAAEEKAARNTDGHLGAVETFGADMIPETEL